MANWCNARLIVVGTRDNVLSFGRAARRRPSSLFSTDILHGEAVDLRSERMVKLEPGIAKKVYLFQICNDDGREHFCEVSRRFPDLCFVLVYWDPNWSPNGSFFIRRGRSRSYELPDQLCDEVMEQHGFTDDSDEDFAYWEASWELMDRAEAYWQTTLLKTARQEPSAGRNRR